MSLSLVLDLLNIAAISPPVWKGGALGRKSTFSNLFHLMKSTLYHCSYCGWSTSSRGACISDPLLETNNLVEIACLRLYEHYEFYLFCVMVLGTKCTHIFELVFPNSCVHEPHREHLKRWFVVKYMWSQLDEERPLIRSSRVTLKQNYDCINVLQLEWIFND